MSEPLELVLKTNPTKVVAYACPDCHCVIHSAHPDNLDVDLGLRKATAEHCVHRCTDCNVVLVKDGATKNYPGYGRRCVACDKKHDQERDQKRFDAAEHLTEDAWEHDACPMVVYLDGEDRYFPDGLDELREWWVEMHYDPNHPDDSEFAFPEYAWVCEETVGVRLDAQQILEQALEEYFEEAIDSVDVDDLQKMMDEWSAKETNQVRSWSPNFNRLVLLSDEKNAKFLEEYRKET